MAKENDLEWGFRRTKTPGMSILDPHVRLAFAIVKTAFVELQDADLVKSFDALCWWLEDAEDWLDMLNLYTHDDGRFFDLVIQSEVGKNG